MSNLFPIWGYFPKAAQAFMNKVERRPMMMIIKAIEV